MEVKEIVDRLKWMYKTTYPLIAKCPAGLLSHLSGLECPTCLTSAVKRTNAARLSKHAYTEQTLPDVYRPLPTPKHRTELWSSGLRLHVINKEDKVARAALRYCVHNIDPAILTRFEHPIPMFSYNKTRIVPMFYSHASNTLIDFVPVRRFTDCAAVAMTHRLLYAQRHAAVQAAKLGFEYKLMLIRPKPRDREVAAHELVSDITHMIAQNTDETAKRTRELLRCAEKIVQLLKS